MTRWLTEEEQPAWRGLLRMTSQLTARANRLLLQEYGISLADYEVLVALSEAPEGQLRGFEVAAALAWEQSRVSHQLARMQRRGLITREGCATDARGAFAVLAPAGRAPIERAAPAHVEQVRQLVFDELSHEQVSALTEITTRVLDRLAEAAGLGAPGASRGCPAAKDQGPGEEAEGRDAGGDADEVPGGPAGLVELGPDLRHVDVRRVARRLDRVVHRHVDRNRDDDGDQIQAERRGDRWQCRRAAVGDAGHQGKDEGAAEGSDHEPGVDDGPVHLLERGDERAVVGLAQTGHDRVRVEREGAGYQAHGEGGAQQGGSTQQCHAASRPGRDATGNGPQSHPHTRSSKLPTWTRSPDCSTGPARGAPSCSAAPWIRPGRCTSGTRRR